MSTQENTPQTIHVPEQGGLSARKQAQIDELLVQMHATTNPDELVVLAERLKLLAQHPADALHTFDESELPEWSIHEEDQENLDAFFNDPADRGKADAAFTIPRGASDPVEVVSGAANKDFTFGGESVLDSALELTLEPKADSVIEHEVGVDLDLEPESEPEPEPELELEPEHALELKADSATGYEAEVDLDLESSIDVQDVSEDEPTDASEVSPAEHSTAVLNDKDEAEKIEIKKAAGETDEAARVAEEATQDTKVKNVSRREDFARFHCIYESKDGQLALYEDEHGHLTAVNTNRFA